MKLNHRDIQVTEIRQFIEFSTIVKRDSDNNVLYTGCPILIDHPE